MKREFETLIELLTACAQEALDAAEKSQLGSSDQYIFIGRSQAFLSASGFVHFLQVAEDLKREKKLLS